MSGGGGGGGSSTKTQQNYSPEEAARRAQIMGEAERIYNQTAQQQQIGVHLANQAMEYGLTGAMDVQNNPYLQSAITAALRPMTQQYVDPGGVLSSIRTNATDSGQFGGVRQGVAEGIAAGRYTQNASDMAGKMASAAYDKGQDTFARTLALAPQTMGLPWEQLQNYANIVYGGANPSTSSVSTADAAKKSRSQGALGGAASGAAIGTAIMPGAGTAIGAVAGGVLGALG